MKRPVVKAILHTLPSSGSGNGVSYWKGWMSCCRAALLKEKEREAQDPKKPLPLPKKPALLVGTIAHALLDLYYKLPKAKALAIDTTAVMWADESGRPLDLNDEARGDAEAIFRAYRTQYAPDELGEVLGTEVQLDGEDICEAVGFSPFSTKPDLIVRASPATVREWRHSRGIEEKPGIWLVDHKTDGMSRENRAQSYIDEIQFTGQMLAVAKRYPRWKIRGLLVNVLGKQARPKFETIVVPFPNEKRAEILRAFLAEANVNRMRALRPGGGVAPCNVLYCHNTYNDDCPYLKRCPRY